MHLSLLTLLLISLPILSLTAPAVSSVHVSFVSGNQATQYSHGSDTDGSSLHLNSLDQNHSHHQLKRRSITGRPSQLDRRGGRKILKKEFKQSTSIEPTTTIPILTTTDILKIDIAEKAIKNAASINKQRGKKRVAFINNNDNNAEVTKRPAKASSTPSASESIIVKEIQNDDEKMETTSAKIKDTKAVKRSPHYSDNYIGFNFPDFDEFGGNDFGNLGDFGASPSNGDDHGHQDIGHSKNAEGLAPDGVFLPPLPTQASNYVENDPYLAEPEVANYAVQHVPFFHEFPHKRTVLALNERREENGLEPNILRSIRPFFAFFEINKRRRRR